MSLDLSGYFDSFLASIALGEPQIGRMDSAADTVSQFLIDQYGLHNSDVFLQGSYANHTAIEPVNNGEYDVDIVVICADANDTCEAALKNLEETFKADVRFAKRLVPKKPCVRIEYANDDVGSFHVDVVPVRRIGNQLESPRKGEEWQPTAPLEYKAWCGQQGPMFMRTVMAIKRWRDEQQPVRMAIRSIVLQVLVARNMPLVADDAGRLTQTFRSMYEELRHLNSPPVVINPVLNSENLAKRWTNESFRSFMKELGEAVEYAESAAGGTDFVEVADIWRELLGEDFPLLSPAQLGIELLDYSHAQSPSEMGWSEALNSDFKVTITATVQRGKRGQNLKTLESNGPLVFQDHKLHYRASVVAPNHVSLWWQVANTGGHAKSVGGLRGEIFKGRDLKKKPIAQNETWESSAYTGSHLIRALAVRESRLVAISDWFQVNIYAKGHPFFR